MELKELVNECAEMIWREATTGSDDNAAATVSTDSGYIDIWFDEDGITVGVWKDNLRGTPHVERFLEKRLNGEMCWDDVLREREQLERENENIYNHGREYSRKTIVANQYFARIR